MAMKEYEIVATQSIYLSKKVMAETEAEANAIAANTPVDEWIVDSTELIIDFLHTKPVELIG
jgi:hypothetical protein